MLQSIIANISKAIRPKDASGNAIKNQILHHVDIPTKKATFGMACFWSPDAIYGATLGVIRTRVGYSGGTKDKPSYRDLGDHTEVIQIDYDPNTIEYGRLLELFWGNHDPTSRNKLQYSSFIFYHDDSQKEVAENSLKEQQNNHSKEVLTQIRPAQKFWDAEDYHQKYRLQQHPRLCEMVGITGSCGDLLKDSYVAARLNGYAVGVGGVEQFDAELPLLGLDEKAASYVRELVKKYEGHGVFC